MYYIVNQDNQLIATDSDFLSLLEIGTLQELFAKTASGQLRLNEVDEETIEVDSIGQPLRLRQKRHSLSTLMGDLILVEVSEIQEETAEEAEEKITFSTDADEDDLITFGEKEEVKPEEKNESFLLEDKEDDFIKIQSEPEAIEPLQEEAEEVEDEHEGEKMHKGNAPDNDGKHKKQIKGLENQIASLKAELDTAKAQGKDHLSFYSVKCISYKVVESDEEADEAVAEEAKEAVGHQESAVENEAEVEDK